MSKVFNIHRAGQLTRWMITTDKPYIRKTGAIFLTMLCLILQMGNLNHLISHSDYHSFFPQACVYAMFAGILLAGGSYFFSSYIYWRDGIRELCMLPASNLEKFTVRYLLSNLVPLVLFLASLVVADGLQYLVGMLLGKPTSWLISDTVTLLGDLNISVQGIFMLVALVIWTNSLFLLGANLLHNIRYNFFFTAAVLFLLFILLNATLPEGPYQGGWTLGRFLKNWNYAVGFGFLALSALNFVLSYRLFSHRPIIGRFVNAF